MRLLWKYLYRKRDWWWQVESYEETRVVNVQEVHLGWVHHLCNFEVGAELRVVLRTLSYLLSRQVEQTAGSQNDLHSVLVLGCLHNEKPLLHNLDVPVQLLHSQCAKLEQVWREHFWVGRSWGRHHLALLFLSHLRSHSLKKDLEGSQLNSSYKSNKQPVWCKLLEKSIWAREG